MAKSLRLNEALAQNGNLAGNHSFHHFWEHWFDTQSQSPAAERSLDEHRVWENAVSFEILALKGSK